MFPTDILLDLQKKVTLENIQNLYNRVEQKMHGNGKKQRESNSFSNTFRPSDIALEMWTISLGWLLNHTLRKLMCGAYCIDSDPAQNLVFGFVSCLA